MISGDRKKPISWYMLIDHCAEGFGPIYPIDDEQIIGIPDSFHYENAPPYIEHCRRGLVYHTVNCADVSEIEFLEEVTP